MLDALLVPLHYDYMWRAIWVSALIGGVCGLLSSFITLKGWSLMGDALSHAIVPGVAIAYLAGLPFTLGAFIAGGLASFSMAWIKQQTRVKEDATIGIVFTTFFAFGLLLISLFPSKIDLKTVLFGNVLGIAPYDILQMVFISIIVVMTLVLKWKDFMLFCFDPNQAKTLGLSVKTLHLVLLMLLSITAIAALQTVGACLVVAMLITPGAIAYLLSDCFKMMLWIATTVGIVTSLLGAYGSYFFNGATGGCIVSVQAFLFIVTLFFAPKHGILAKRYKASKQEQGRA